MHNNQDVKICLNMIVKNESAIIHRLIDSVLPIIDSYCICDTGSTDKTPELIENYFKLKGIPGKVVREPFQDFGYNRTKALEFCYGLPNADYLLLIDADMVLKIPHNFDVSLFKQRISCGDAHYILQGTDSFYYKNIRIIKNRPNLSYWGVTHEYINLPDDTIYGFFNKEDIFIWDIGDGGAKSDKYERDIRLLTKGLEEKPNNDRYTFYLANSLRDAGRTDEAIEAYKKRIALGGWMEEPWYSNYSLGKIYKDRNQIDKAVYYWLEAYASNPSRIENLYEIINYYRINGKNDLAYMFYRIASEKRNQIKNWDFLFLEKDIYDFKLDYEFSILGYYINPENKDLVQCSMKLLDYHTVQPNIYNNIMSNYKFYVPQLKGEHEVKYEILSKMGDEMDCIKNYLGSTPSICMHNGELIVNRRFVNYKIDEKGNYINGETINTINIIGSYSIKENILIENDIQILKYNENYDGYYKGLEDIRLFSYKNEILYNANRGVDGKMRIEHGKIMFDDEFIHTKDESLLNKENLANIEKNWVLFTDINNNLKCVYKWYPLTIGSIENNELKHIEEIKMPNSFKYIRGSTNGVSVGNEVWFLCHTVSYEDRRYYYHILIALDKVTMRLRRHTPFFTFTNNKVEYTLGFVKHKNQFIIGYSAMDKSTMFISVNEKSFSDMFNRLGFDSVIDESENITISL
jgi:tetratricopeptide (TPR) repeat protein